AEKAAGPGQRPLGWRRTGGLSGCRIGNRAKPAVRQGRGHNKRFAPWLPRASAAAASQGNPPVFTGIIQAVATIAALRDQDGLRTFTMEFPEGFCQDLAVGASVSHDGVCLTVTENLSPTSATFDVMQQSLAITTLGSYKAGAHVNVERAAKDG